jgi:hypothetical protein
MKKTNFKKKLICVLSFVLIAVMALTMFGCGKETTDEVPETDVQAVNRQVMGEGKLTFDFNVTDADGNVSYFEINTNKKTVGEALMELELLEGEDGPYGLYVKAVNGITYDYDKDGKYWAFYINGVYGTTGVETTNIVNGATYEFKAEA